ncbi:MAG: hypothetical protein R3E84_22035 [Pseudomonadales bacterium]
MWWRSTTILMGLQGRAYLHYWGALVLLGIGWNFLFVGGTTLLVANYRPAERFQMQAVNDFSVFGMSALASLMGGAVLLQFCWENVLALAALPLVLVVVRCCECVTRRRQRRGHRCSGVCLRCDTAVGELAA